MATKASSPEIIKLEAKEVDDLQQRIAARQLTERDYDLFAAIVAAYYFVVNLLTQKKLTIARLKKLVFGRGPRRPRRCWAALRKEPLPSQPARRAAVRRQRMRRRRAPSQAAQAAQGPRP